MNEQEMNSENITSKRSVVRKPFKWEELQSIISAGELHKLSRSEAQEQTYRKARGQIKDEWESIYDFILCTKFQFLVDDDRGQKKRSKPTFEEWQSMQKSDSDAILVLSPNDFPYYFEEGIHHYVLWKLGGIVTAIEIENGKKEILQKAGKAGCLERSKDSSIFLHWLNPPELKSLPDVDHVHILFRKPIMNETGVLVSC